MSLPDFEHALFEFRRVTDVSPSWAEFQIGTCFSCQQNKLGRSASEGHDHQNASAGTLNTYPIRSQYAPPLASWQLALQ